MPFFKTDDNVEIYYEELGEGDRCLICTQCDHNGYTLERELAKRGFHVFLLTNRGFGRSTHVTEDYGDHWYDRFAKDVIAFADFKGIDRFVYSGASHGAGAGWHVVLNYPERVICFFAVVPGPHNIDESRLSYRTMSMMGIAPPKPCFRAETDDGRILRRRAQEDEYRRKLREAPDYEEVYNSPETRAIDYGRPLRAYGTEENVVKALSTIETPTLVIGGMLDTISRPDLMLRTAKALKNCKLVIYSGVGHEMGIVEEVADEAVRFYENLVSTGYFYAPLKEEIDL